MMEHLDNNDCSTAPGQGQSFTDIHCHCLPDIDDGPEDMAKAIELCRGLFDDGMKTVIATPHQLGRYGDFNTAGDIREKVAELNDQLRAENINLSIVPGADVRVDERLCKLIDEDMVLTLGDTGEYILLELPHEIFIDIEPLLSELSAKGVRPIVSHPERHRAIANNPELMDRWFRHCTYLQITAGSLVGNFGGSAQKAAWYFLKSGLAHLVATDSHNLIGRRPCMREAFESIKNELGESVAELVCVVNPLKVLNGEHIDSTMFSNCR